ncbi:hypothetical protein BASA62_009876 [Batrachochytrium salamandrivorans]|nr:hypothetical protein BASA62_009876 [Batrachochytrium salamandrivorans]
MELTTRLELQSQTTRLLSSARVRGPRRGERGYHSPWRPFPGALALAASAAGALADYNSPWTIRFEELRPARSSPEAATGPDSKHLAGSSNRQITPPTKNGHAPPTMKSRKCFQTVNPSHVWTCFNLATILPPEPKDFVFTYGAGVFLGRLAPVCETTPIPSRHRLLCELRCCKACFEHSNLLSVTEWRPVRAIAGPDRPGPTKWRAAGAGPRFRADPAAGGGSPQAREYNTLPTKPDRGKTRPSRPPSVATLNEAGRPLRGASVALRSEKTDRLSVVLFGFRQGTAKSERRQGNGLDLVRTRPPSPARLAPAPARRALPASSRPPLCTQLPSKKRPGPARLRRKPLLLRPRPVTAGAGRVKEPKAPALHSP